MHAIGQQDDVSVGLGVHPHGRAGEAGVAERADGEELAAIARMRRIDIPAEAAQDGLIGRGLRLGELGNGERPEDSDALERAAIEHHLGETRQVVGGGEQAGMSRHTAHVAGRGVVHHAAQGRRIPGGALGGRDPGYQRGGRLEHAGVHAERQEHVFARVRGDHAASQAVYQLAQQNEIDVAIDIAHAGRAGGAERASQTDAGIVSRPGLLQWHVGLKPGEMRQKIAQSDVALSALEFGNVVGDFIVQAELALLEELHQRRRGSHHLGERSAVEDGIYGHILRPRHQRALAVRLAINHLAIMAHNQHGARKTARFNRLVDGLVQVLGC